jgi:hypothetical protein
MTTLNLQLQRATHPQRKPFVRSHTFIDDKGPPPYSFFDETQDHLGVLYQAALGWGYNCDADEFTELGSRSGYFGRLFIRATYGLTVGPKTSGLSFGEHGVYAATSGTEKYLLQATSGALTFDGDFLITAKVQLRGREHLDAVAVHGFRMAAGPVFTSVDVPVYPSFLAGSDSPNWWVEYGPTLTAAAVRVDTGIPVQDGAWYRLQISRVAGAVRWFVNGQLVRMAGAEGVYFPFRLLDGGKFLRIARLNPGPSNEGLEIDSFHLLAERTNNS